MLISGDSHDSVPKKISITYSRSALFDLTFRQFNNRQRKACFFLAFRHDGFLMGWLMWTDVGPQVKKKKINFHLPSGLRKGFDVPRTIQNVIKTKKSSVYQSACISKQWKSYPTCCIDRSICLGSVCGTKCHMSYWIPFLFTLTGLTYKPQGNM